MKIEYGHDGGVNRCVLCCMEISQMQPAVLSVNDCTSNRISITARRCTIMVSRSKFTIPVPVSQEIRSGSITIRADRIR